MTYHAVNQYNITAPPLQYNILCYDNMQYCSKIGIVFAFMEVIRKFNSFIN